MKNIIRSAALLLCAVMLLSCLSGCSILHDLAFESGTDQGNDKKPQAKKQTITVYHDGTAKTYTATLGKVAEIDIFTKPGYYFAGAYDAEEGGTKYFDGNGRSTMVWGAGNPDTYYVRYESIYSLNYTEKQREEEPYKWNGIAGEYVTFVLPEPLKQAIAANLDKNLWVNVSVDISCDADWAFKNIDLKTLRSGGETYVLGKGLQLKGGTYKTFTYSVSVPARLLQSGEIYLYLKGLDSNLINAAYYYYKNAFIAASFENTEGEQ